MIRSESNTMGRISAGKMKGYEELANAIVYRAFRDYQKALIDLHFRPSDIWAERNRRDCVRFFHSEYFAQLSNLDGDYLMELAEKQVVANNYNAVFKETYCSWG